MPEFKAHPYGSSEIPTHIRKDEEKWRTFLRSHREGARLTGVVRVVQEYGAFIELPDSGYQGLVHRSEILPGKMVDKVEEVLWPGDRVVVVVKRIDMARRHVHLSMAAAFGTTAAYPPEAGRPPATQEDFTAELHDLFSGLKARPGRLQRILLVEDQEDVQDSLKQLLEQAGYEVAAIREDKDVPGQAAAFEPDLILLDAHFYGLEGIELAPALSTACPAARVILMTGNPFSPEEEQCLAEMPRVDWLEKPFGPPELDELLMDLESGHPPALLRKRMADARQRRAEPANTRRQREVHQELRAAAQRLLAGLVEDTHAAAGAVFEMDQITQQVGLLVDTGIDPADFERARRDLRFSPVKDVILDHEKICEADAVAHRPGKFQYLLKLLDFRACLGYYLVTAGMTGYALFLFHPDSGHFTPAHRRQAENIALALSALIERAQMEKGLIDDQKYSLPGKMSAGLTHEVNNRMAALENERTLIAGYLQRLGPLLPGTGSENALFNKLSKQTVWLDRTVNELKTTIDSFRDLSKIPETDVCSPEKVVHQVCDLLTSQIKKRYDVNLVALAPLPNLPRVGVNDVALQQSLINLILNAAQQVKESGRARGWVHVSLELDEDDPAHPVHILVADNGPGIHGRLWEQVFELGFSTRPNGSGLGLFVSRSLLEPFGGEIAIRESLMHAGTTFVIALPAAASERQA